MGVSHASSALTAVGRSGGTATCTRSSTERCINTSASTAGSLFLRMVIKTESIVVALATLPTDMESRMIAMKVEYRARLEQYMASMLQAKKLMTMGILTSEDYAIIDTIIAEKYGISSCSIYRGIDLIYGEISGNMSHYEEVMPCQEQ